MREYNEIKKIIEIKDSFNVRFPYHLIYGNGLIPRIMVCQFEGGYKIFTFNTDEWGSTKLYHGEYVYIVKAESIEYYYYNFGDAPEPYPYKFDPFPTSPWGWGEEEKKYLNDLLRILQEGLNNNE